VKEQRGKEGKKDIGIFGCDFVCWGKSVGRDEMV